MTWQYLQLGSLDIHYTCYKKVNFFYEIRNLPQNCLIRLAQYSWMMEHYSSVECKKVVSAFLSFCGKSNFVLRFSLYFIVFLTTCFVHKNVNTLSWDLNYDSKCVILHVLSISITNSISPKMSLTTFLHSHDVLSLLHIWTNIVVFQLNTHG